MEKFPHTINSIPEAEQINDMDNSPVTEREMNEAVDALKDMDMPVIEKEIDESLVTKEEMQQAVEALNMPEPETSKDSVEDRIRILKEELSNIPPTNTNDQERGFGGNGGGRREEGTLVEYKKCEICHGTGKRYLLLKCPRCGGTGREVVSVKHNTGLNDFFEKTNERVIKDNLF